MRETEEMKRIKLTGLMIWGILLIIPMIIVYIFFNKNIEDWEEESYNKKHGEF
jgi:uncharacterized SAM-binding protein YcdF (DUF218 family)